MNSKNEIYEFFFFCLLDDSKNCIINSRCFLKIGGEKNAFVF